MLKRIRRGICLLIIALLLVLLVLCYVTPQQAVCDKDAYSGKEECPTYPILIAPFAWLIATCDNHAGAFTALAGIAVAYFTFTLKRSTDKLWQASEDQRKDGRKAILASLVSADAAKKSAKTAERALVELERPWVVISYDARIEDLRSNLLPPLHANFRVFFDLVNAGRSPAFITDFQSNIMFWKRGECPDMVYAMGGTLPDGLVIVAGGKHEIGRGNKFSETAFSDAEKNGERLIAFGKVGYRDVFGQTHETSFCRWVDQNPPALRLADCPKLNYYT